MDSSARWFLAGIVVSLINTGLVIVFIGIPGITDDNDSASASAPAEARTFIVVVDEQGNVLQQRIELGAGGVPASAAVPATAAGGAGDTLLGLGAPLFGDVEGAASLAAHDGVAYVTTRRFALQAVDLEGEVDEVDLDGIDDLGASRVVGVDVTSDGSVYVLVNDGALEWRVFELEEGEDEWDLLTSADELGWPAEVLALTVTDTGVIYVSAEDPQGIFRVEPDLATVRRWVRDARTLGLHAAEDDSRLLFVAPEVLAEEPARQVRQVRQGRVGVWTSTYRGCGAAVEGAGEEAEATPESGVLVPQLPRDVAIVDHTTPGADTALIVDSLNHVVWYQTHFEGGQPLFGVPCERGTGDGHLNSPRGVAIDEDGNVFIADWGNDRVVVLPRR